MSERPTVDEVRVGDTMRISVGLIREIAAQDDCVSEIVRLVKVEVEADGTKTLWVERDQ